MADLNLTTFAADSFTGATLDIAINKAAFAPGVLALSKLYAERGVDSTNVQLELVARGIRLVQSTPRGAPAPVHVRSTRNLVTFTAPHLRTRDTILASSWQDVRGFGEANLASVERERDRLLGDMRQDLESTIEYHRARALAGQILDADGSVLIDLLAEFNVLQNTHDMQLDVATTSVINQVVAAKRKSEIELGAMVPKSWVVYHSASFGDAFYSHPNVVAAYQGSLSAAALTNDTRNGFFYGGVLFIEMRNPVGITMVEDGAAYLVPEGVPNLFTTHFAPADYVETANTMGLPIYARAHELPFMRGWQIEAQANPVSICSTPRAVVKLTA